MPQLIIHQSAVESPKKSWTPLQTFKIYPQLRILFDKALLKGQVLYTEPLETIREYHIFDYIDENNIDHDYKTMQFEDPKLRQEDKISEITVQSWFYCIYAEFHYGFSVNSEIPMSASKWPAFLYNVDMYDLKDPERGLFLGFILYRVFYSIFFGASSAFNGKIQPKSIADKNGMQKVIGRHIAYTGVQARFALSASDDDDPSNTEFYSEIMDYFEDEPQDERVVQLLEGWNKIVFGHPQGRQDSAIVKAKHISRNGSNAPPSTTSIVRAARKAWKIQCLATMADAAAADASDTST